MLVQFGDSQIELVQGDIVQQSVDAIVNAANSDLAGGGGVDGAIHSAAGPTVMDETDMLYPDGCPTGDAVATTAGRLNAKYIFHAVGPIWRGGTNGEPQLLASAYQRCFELADEHKCQSIALPTISTGVYRFPQDKAAEISLRVAREFLLQNESARLVRFVLFSAGPFGAFSRVLESMAD